MNEFVMANGRTFECINTSTGIDSVSLEIINQDAADLEAFFGGVSSLTIHYEESAKTGENMGTPILREPHGIFNHLKLNFVNKNVLNDSVIIIMHIKSEIERRLDALEESQEKQNEAISMLGNTSGISI